MTPRRDAPPTFRRKTPSCVSPRTTTVEFLGLPASGKSTVAKLMTARLGTDGYVTSNMAVGRDGYILAPLKPAITVRHPRRPLPRVKAAQKVRLAFQHWRLVATISRVLARSSRGLQHRLFTLRRVLTTLGRWDSVSRASGTHDVAVFEEGLLQHAFLVFIDDRGRWDTRELSRYLSAAVHADLVVHLALPPGESLRRQLQRAESAAEPAPISRRFRSLDRMSLEHVLGSGDDLLREIAQRVRMDEDCRVLHLDATEPPEALAAALEEEIVTILSDGDRNGDG
jgi:hypothetical protein